jgi:CRP-like cAMP-binding protein
MGRTIAHLRNLGQVSAMPTAAPTALSADLSEWVFAARGWLSRVPPALRARILAATEVRHFGAGDAVVSAGQTGGGPFGLLQGRVGCWATSAHSGPTLGYVAVPGDWFGQGPVQLGVERSVSFRALEPSVLHYLPALRIQQMAAADPGLHRQFAQLSETSAQLLAGLVADLLVQDAERRLASVLLRAARFELDMGPLASAPLPLGQFALSELAGLSRSHVNRILRRWMAAGLVSTGYNQILVRTIAGLEAIAQDS